jgi:hypothetical protein
MAQADIVNLSTKPDGTFNWGNAMRGAMSTIAAADLETVDRLASHRVCSVVETAGALGAGQTLNSNRAVFMRAVGSGPVSKIGLDIATSSGNICVAVYANTGTGPDARPSTRKQTSGSVACPSAGYAEVALGASVNVEHGDWLCLVVDNATAAFRALSGSTFAGNGLWAGRAAYEDSAFPAPATATPINGLVKGPILVGIP